MTEKEKDEICKLTGLKNKQIKSWLQNVRRQQKKTSKKIENKIKLSKFFETNNKPTTKQFEKFSKSIGLSIKQIKKWHLNQSRKKKRV